MSFKEIKKVNVSDEVYRQILNEIIDRNLQPGDKLPSEAELVRTFGVSRVSVRAALQKLNGAGIIECVNGGGSYVKNIQAESVLGGIVPLTVLGDYDMSQLVDFRRGIEVLSAELAARFGSEEETAELEKIYNDMENYDKLKDLKAYSKADMEFHMQIARMSKNPFVIYVMEQLEPIIQSHITELNENLGSDNGLHYHYNVFKMIKAHNQGGAREAMNLNLLNTLQEVVEV